MQNIAFDLNCLSALLFDVFDGVLRPISNLTHHATTRNRHRGALAYATIYPPFPKWI